MPFETIEPGGPSDDPDLPLSPSGALDRALLQLATRIESVLLEEQHVLASQPDELDRLTARKEHLALEVSRLSRATGGVVPDPHVRQRLEMTSKRLAENSRLLRRHIDAVSEIAALVAGVVNRATGDGTYSRYAARQDRSS